MLSSAEFDAMLGYLFEITVAADDAARSAAETGNYSRYGIHPKVGFETSSRFGSAWRKREVMLLDSVTYWRCAAFLRTMSMIMMVERNRRLWLNSLIEFPNENAFISIRIFHEQSQIIGQINANQTTWRMHLKSMCLCNFAANGAAGLMHRCTNAYNCYCRSIRVVSHAVEHRMSRRQRIV